MAKTECFYCLSEETTPCPVCTTDVCAAHEGVHSASHGVTGNPPNLNPPNPAVIAAEAEAVEARVARETEQDIDAVRADAQEEVAEEVTKMHAKDAEAQAESGVANEVPPNPANKRHQGTGGDVDTKGAGEREADAARGTGEAPGSAEHRHEITTVETETGDAKKSTGKSRSSKTSS